MVNLRNNLGYTMSRVNIRFLFQILLKDMGHDGDIVGRRIVSPIYFTNLSWSRIHKQNVY